MVVVAQVVKEVVVVLMSKVRVGTVKMSLFCISYSFIMHA